MGGAFGPRLLVAGNPGWGRMGCNMGEREHNINQESEGVKETAPDGWYNLNQLTTRLSYPRETIERIIEKFRSSNPEWYKQYLGGNRQPTVFFHPELVARVSEDLELIEPPPTGWLNLNQLSKELHVSRNTLQSMFSRLLSGHPDWSHRYAVGSQELDFFHPDLIQAVRLELANRPEPAPSGWYNLFGASKLLHQDRASIQKIFSEHEQTHPEWFKEFRNAQNVSTLYFHPDLIEIARQAFEREVPPPEGWLNIAAIAKNVGHAAKFIESRLGEFETQNPASFGSFHEKGKMTTRYYDPAVIDFFHQLPIRSVTDARSTLEKIPEDWLGSAQAAEMLALDKESFAARLARYRKEHPDWFLTVHDRDGRVRSYYSPELIRAMGEVLEALPPRAPEGWMHLYGLSGYFDRPRSVIENQIQLLRPSHPEWMRQYSTPTDQISEYYHPDLVKELEKLFAVRPQVAPEGWLTESGIAKSIGKSKAWVTKRLKEFRSDHPEWVGFYLDAIGHRREHFGPSLVGALKSEIAGAPDMVPEGWVTLRTLADSMGREFYFVKKLVDGQRVAHPEWIGNFQSPHGRIEEFLHPDLAAFLMKETGPGRVAQGQLREDIKQSLLEFEQGITGDATVFQKLITFCGSDRAVDILFRFRPEYKSIPVEYVKKVLADYLGDFLTVKRGFELRDAKEVAEYMSDLTLKEGLFETLKQDCLSFYYTERRQGVARSDREIIEAYLDYAVHELGDINNKDVDDVVQDVVTYFDRLFSDIKRPDNMVERLGEGRDFPDVNQRINMRELREKQRMLIADEMGLGKSGSAIFAKEALGVERTLLVVPSNVVATWQNYLSDKSERGGYFKPGEAPKVLVVESPHQLQAADVGEYDYLILSHGRLDDRYIQDLKTLDIGMMIVDESHMLKDLKGKRSQQMLELSKQVAGEGKYLAMLSGTPVPNTVNDVAVILKMLYPEKFGDADERHLVGQIVRGDILDLRSLLIPRMQMKSLRESVEMPELREEVKDVELSEAERTAYEMLFEEDEVEANDKMRLLRQFLLNPELLDPTPGFESAKLQTVQAELREAFARQDKVVLFVNGYIEDVIRGELSILPELDLPGVRVETIHGEVGDRERQRIQKMVKESSGKMLLVMSGQTAGVGVDFSSADQVFFYNEPWTEFDRLQQLSRVYRPGLSHPLESRTFMAKGTIEEGIHRHIQAKYQSIQKLLRGIPITELEQELLKRSSKDNEVPGAEVNPELAKYYFSSWDRMMKIFSYVKEIGEPDFEKFLEKFSREYAECYMELGSRSYQANANRVSATMIDRMIRASGIETERVAILDAASGPEMLKRHIAGDLQDRVFSLDLNAAHFQPDHERKFVGSFLQMPFDDKSFDYVNLTLAWHYTSFVPTRGQYERMQVLQEMNRVLREGGRAVINMIYSLEFRDPERFRDAVELLGYEIVEEASGEVRQGDRYSSRLLTLEKRHDVTLTLEELIAQLGEKDLLKAFKFKQTEGKLRDSRRILSSFEFGGRSNEVKFNDEDRAVLEEEQKVTADGNALKTKYKEIQAIPRDVVIANGFVRMNNGKRYVLFKKLTKGPGAVVIR